MTEIQNPIIPGMAPDPSIIRVGEDYYIATSTFHWNPGIQIFHSKDLFNWDLLTHVLQHGEVNLRGTNTPAGIWAPHLSYDEKTACFGWHTVICRIWPVVSLILNPTPCMPKILLVLGQNQSI